MEIEERKNLRIIRYCHVWRLGEILGGHMSVSFLNKNAILPTEPVGIEEIELTTLHTDKVGSAFEKGLGTWHLI